MVNPLLNNYENKILQHLEIANPKEDSAFF